MTSSQLALDRRERGIGPVGQAAFADHPDGIGDLFRDRLADPQRRSTICFAFGPGNAVTSRGVFISLVVII